MPLFLDKARIPRGGQWVSGGNRPPRTVVIELPVGANFPSVSDGVTEALNAHPGDCEVLLDLFFPEEAVRVRTRTARFVRVTPTQSFQEQLSALGVRMSWLDLN